MLFPKTCWLFLPVLWIYSSIHFYWLKSSPVMWCIILICNWKRKHALIFWEVIFLKSSTKEASIIENASFIECCQRWYTSYFCFFFFFFKSVCSSRVGGGERIRFSLQKSVGRKSKCSFRSFQHFQTCFPVVFLFDLE